MNPYLRKKVEERAAVSDLISGRLEQLANENREPTSEEQSQLDDWERRCATLDKDIAHFETMARGNDTFASTVGRLSQLDEKKELRQAENRDKPKVETRSAGQQFVDSDAFKAYRGRGSMEPIEFGGFLETRSAITLGTLEDIIQPHQFSVTDPVLRTPLLDVIGRELVGVGSVEYIQWSDANPAGGPIPEGEPKPEATLEPKITPVALETFAHWKAITRQALEDYPRIRSIVEGNLRAGLAKKLEEVATAVILAADFATVANADPLAGTRHAVGVVQSAGFQPNAILLNPGDYADFDIQAAEASSSGPTAFGTFWGLRAVPVPGIPAGTQYVGDFAEAVTWFDRNTAAVYLTDSHADYMIRNLLLLLAEQRGAFAATNPAAAVKVSATEPDTEGAAAASTSSSKKAAAA